MPRIVEDREQMAPLVEVVHPPTTALALALCQPRQPPWKQPQATSVHHARWKACLLALLVLLELF
jgi:hypothetical protein